eukprot:CAMPEP_0168602506 /NCGR_PEP_ID=MMETSP0420-20121227/14143_1 /TAXON_ID=498008 /ORGANISM="Pessonella sp." /LENGTH=476 /DNA_ID=CAMNT_0008641247 /DNA_START=269 /DNA_END=1696 /DNA_ORIENTATION=+
MRKLVAGCVAVPNVSSIPLYVVNSLCVAIGGPLLRLRNASAAPAYVAFAAVAAELFVWGVLFGYFLPSIANGVAPPASSQAQEAVITVLPVRVAVASDSSPLQVLDDLSAMESADDERSLSVGHDEDDEEEEETVDEEGDVKEDEKDDEKDDEKEDENDNDDDNDKKGKLKIDSIEIPKKDEVLSERQPPPSPSPRRFLLAMRNNRTILLPRNSSSTAPPALLRADSLIVTNTSLADTRLMHAGVPRRRPLPVLQRLRTSLSSRRTASGRVVPGGSGRAMSPRADMVVVAPASERVAPPSRRTKLKALIARVVNPPFVATLLGILIALTPLRDLLHPHSPTDSAPPLAPLTTVLRTSAAATVPALLLLVGFAFAALPSFRASEAAGVRWRDIVGVVCLRLLIMPALVLFVLLLLFPVDSELPDWIDPTLLFVILLQSCTPTNVDLLIISQIQNTNVFATSLVVFYTYAVSIITLPA